MKHIFRLLRIRQWVKNGLVFAAIVFSHRFLDLDSWLRTIMIFFGLSFVASSIYIVNDIFDIESDRRHPVKRNRPIAAGLVKIPVAITIAVAMAAIGLYIAFQLNFITFVVLLGYFVVMILYSSHLKNILLLDVLIIASGMTARAVLGAEAIEVDISPWLLVCTFLIALMLALVKRRQELSRAGYEYVFTRKNLIEAPEVQIWDHWISAVSGITILAYILYTVDETTVAKVGSTHLLFTVPFVIYGIFRYQIKVYKANQGEDPTETLLHDKSMWLVIILWMMSVVLIFSMR
jgi:4-hydroxybenzoate polyprenyltransferase